MEILTFYKLDENEKKTLKEDSPEEKRIKYLQYCKSNLELQLKITKGKMRNIEEKTAQLEKEKQELQEEILSLKNDFENKKKILKENIKNLINTNNELNKKIIEMEISHADEIKALKNSGKKISYKNGDNVFLGGYEWLVIEATSEKALLLCKKCVAENVPYSRVLTAENGKDYTGASTVNWKNCTIRYWLNNVFDKQFSGDDKAKILPANHENTTDRFFLLSKEEFIKTKKIIFSKKNEMNIHNDWWLRNSENGYCSVGNLLNIQTQNKSNNKKAVRPAVYIKNRE